MPTYVTEEGEKFVATDTKDLVRQLAMTSFGDSDTGIMQYMRDVASRSQRAASVAVRCDNVDNFVADMLQHGLLKQES
jgi:hypothetical protein